METWLSACPYLSPAPHRDVSPQLGGLRSANWLDCLALAEIVPMVKYSCIFVFVFTFYKKDPKNL
jgi:hypothetical protein